MLFFSYKNHINRVYVSIYKMSEQDCKNVSSRGLLKSCDVKSAIPWSSIRQTVYYDFSQLKEGDMLYLCSSAIPYFRTHIFPDIRVAFRLVSGDCDESCPEDIFTSRDDFLAFIEDARIIVWFAQNSRGNIPLRNPNTPNNITNDNEDIRSHPKLHQLPIGQDYHTMSGPNSWGPVTRPIDQERLLNHIRTTAPPLADRICQAHANFHFSMTTKFAYDRYDALNQIPKEWVYYEPERCGRLQTWKKQAEYAFVISPHGNGLDCHRTWEALALGCIPIVKTSVLDPLFEGLPVKIVNQWSDITHELLAKTQKEYAERTDWQMEKLTLEYWVNKIRRFMRSDIQE